MYDILLPPGIKVLSVFLFFSYRILSELCILTFIFILTFCFYRFAKNLCAHIFFRIIPCDQLTFNIFKVNNRSTRKKSCEICSKLTIQTQERRQWRRSNVFIINFEYISQLFLVFLLLNLKKRMLAGLCVTWTYSWIIWFFLH